MKSAHAMSVGSMLVVWGLTAIVGCSSDGGTPSSSTGSEGQGCYANGTCNAGLACATGNLCQRSSSQATADADGGAADGSTSKPDGTLCKIPNQGCDDDCLLQCGVKPNCEGASCTKYEDPGVFCGGKCMPEGTLSCNGQCIKSDKNNCGTCGNVCPANMPQCVASKCTAGDP